MTTHSRLTPQHAVVDGPVLGKAAILTLECKGQLHQLNAGVLQELEHCLVSLGGTERDLEVVPADRQEDIAQSHTYHMTSVSP